ncbi:MAG: ATP-binding protein [Slackia sp.]
MRSACARCFPRTPTASGLRFLWCAITPTCLRGGSIRPSTLRYSSRCLRFSPSACSWRAAGSQAQAAASDRGEDDAARRIAEGDLSVPVAVPAEESRSELDRLCASFETMREHLERNNKAMWRVAENRRKVNAAFAHDLRTPLTVLKGRAEMLSTFAPEGLVDAEQLAEASRAMSRQTERLQRYVESMEDLADVDECSVEPREGDVGAWFVRTAAEASDLVRSSGKEFEAKAGGLPRHAAFDDVALSRIVENALSNALRYAQTSVSLSCCWKEGMLTVRVQDDGPGFDDAALEHGCEPFWRNAAEKRREDSAHFGLGLNICAELCEKHGGFVRLSNAAGGGAAVEACVAAPLAGHAS